MKLSRKGEIPDRKTIEELCRRLERELEEIGREDTEEAAELREKSSPYAERGT